MSKLARTYRKAEFRALENSEKALAEQRTDLMDEMENMINKSKVETRALTTDENKRFKEIRTEIENIDNTLDAIKEKRSLDTKTPLSQGREKEQRVIDEENFLKFVKGEERALTVADNGGIIPTTIADRIITKVKELSPIYSMAQVFNVGGDLVFPVYDEERSTVNATYVEDLTELTEGTGKFTIVKLQNFIVGCLAKISKSLMNRTDFDLVNFIIGKVAKAIAEFLERELIQGTPNKMDGLASTTNVIISAAPDKITADELIDLQMEVPEIYQANAVWIMHKSTFKAIRKLKDAYGDYLMSKDLTNGFSWSLLGRPVYVTQSADQMGAGKKAVFYGDMSGLYVKLTKNVEIQVLLEKYATQNAIGVVGYVECDSKIVEKQKIVALQMKA